MRRISRQKWEQVKVAYASGIPLRALAREMHISPGTILARAKREGWTRQIEEAKALACSGVQSNAITPMQSIAALMQERGERYRERIAGVSERLSVMLRQCIQTKFSPAVRNLRKSTRLHVGHLD